MLVLKCCCEIQRREVRWRDGKRVVGGECQRAMSGEGISVCERRLIFI